MLGKKLALKSCEVLILSPLCFQTPLFKLVYTSLGVNRQRRQFATTSVSMKGPKPISCYKTVTKTIETARINRMIDKLMASTGKPKQNLPVHTRYVPSHELKEFGSLAKGASKSSKPISGKIMRRLSVLNTLFIEQITSLLATGEISPEFLGLGIQITKVKVANDFGAVDVYWHASGTEKDDVIEKLLQRTSSHLRHTLSQLRVIGVVPPIRFHKDTTYSSIQEVESLLAKCDFGQNYKSQAADNFKGVSNVDEEKEDDAQDSVEEVVDEPMMMRQDVLSLKHDVIMDRIKKSIQAQTERKLQKQRKAAETIQAADSCGEHLGEKDQDDFLDTKTLAGALEETENYKKRQREFLKYLKQQQAERQKELKRQSAEAKEREFLMQQMEERGSKNLAAQLRELDNENDYNDDDDEGIDHYQMEEEFYEKFREDFK